MLRRIILSLTIFLSVLSIPVAQTMSWNFWTQHNYKNTWLMGAGLTGLGLLCHLLEGENSPQTPEEWCDQTSRMVDLLYSEYGAKIAAFEHAYKITGS